MAPDAASAAAGRKLGSAAKWQTLGQTERLIWGEIEGSGSKPYQACIDVAGPAFKCSCPSRKFPCKHGLGLAFAHAEAAQAFASDTPPEWVAEWLEKREARAERQAKRDAAEDDKPVDDETRRRRAAAQGKRREQREEKILAGIAELQHWLDDSLRQGLARALDQTQAWDHMRARLVDAQAPGLARWLRRCQEARYLSEDWQGSALRALSGLQLLLDAYPRRASLPEPLAADLEELVGLPHNKERLLAQTGIEDSWRVMGKWIAEEERLQVQRTWLRGEQTRRWALLLDFAAASAVLPITPVEGASIFGELVFYPSAWPLRALIKTQDAPQDVDAASLMAGALGGLDALYAGYAECLTRMPWIERFPATLGQVAPLKQGDEWLLVDGAGKSVPIARQFPLRWELLAIGGGRGLDVFGEWDGEAFFPLTVIADGRVQGMQAAQMELV
nr:hypothetical protein [Thiorhodococcus minor]